MSYKLYVGNLPTQLPEEMVLQTLASCFSKCGTIEDVFIIRDKLTNMHRGFGFITMKEEQAARNALSLAGQFIFPGHDKGIKMDVARERRQQPLHASASASQFYTDAQQQPVDMAHQPYPAGQQPSFNPTQPPFSGQQPLPGQSFHGQQPIHAAQPFPGQRTPAPAAGAPFHLQPSFSEPALRVDCYGDMDGNFSSNPEALPV